LPESKHESFAIYLLIKTANQFNIAIWVHLRRAIAGTGAGGDADRRLGKLRRHDEPSFKLRIGIAAGP
jgi:hypothetical protein